MAFVASFSFLTGFYACAKETSDEERRREDDNRQYARLEKAAGEYFGYVEAQPGKVVPLGLSLTTSRSPQAGGDKPSLTGSLRIGVLGGVTLASGATSYDWGSGKLAITFNRKSGAPLELRGRISNGKFVEAKLDGPNTGAHDVELMLNGANLFDDQDLFLFDAAVTDDSNLALSNFAPIHNAQLSLRRTSTAKEPTADSDMPLLPALDASLRFMNLGQVPQVATSVAYDPLTGIVDVTMRDSSGLHIDDVFISKADLPADATASLDTTIPARLLRGTVVVGAQPYGYIFLDGKFPAASLKVADQASIRALPPGFFAGTYQGSKMDFALPAVASIEYLNASSENSAEYPFREIPKLRMKLLLCDGTAPLLPQTMEIQALDQVHSRVRFASNASTSAAAAASSGAGSEENTITFNADWSEINGRFSNKSSDTVMVGEPQLLMKSTAGVRSLTCGSIGKNLARSITINAGVLGIESANLIASATDSDRPLSYGGFLADKAGKPLVPAHLDVIPRGNPTSGGDEPSIGVTLKLGFFGSVILSSESAYFDWVTGTITASFKRPTGSPLEVKFTPKEEVLDDATFTGPNQGTSKLVLTRGETGVFETGKEANFAFVSTGTGGPSGPNTGPVPPPIKQNGLLTIMRLDNDTAAAPNMDLPAIPTLQVALRFDAVPQSPQTAKNAIYDPLHGTLSLSFAGSTTLDFTNIFLTPKDDQTLAAPTQLNGRLLVAGAAKAVFDLSRIPENQHPVDAPPMQTTFKGTFVAPAANAVVFKTYGILEYKNSERPNTGEFPFSSFPELRLKIGFCAPGTDKEYMNKTMSLNSYDHVTGLARFKSDDANPSGVVELLLAVEAGWNMIDGNFSPSGGGSSAGGLSGHVHLEAASLGNNGCAQQKRQ